MPNGGQGGDPYCFCGHCGAFTGPNGGHGQPATCDTPYCSGNYYGGKDDQYRKPVESPPADPVRGHYALLQDAVLAALESGESDASIDDAIAGAYDHWYEQHPESDG